MPPVEDDAPPREERSPLDQKIEDCELSVRTMNVCNELGINTARELFATSEEALKRAPGFHRNVLADIAGWFEESGIVWPPR